MVTTFIKLPKSSIPTLKKKKKIYVFKIWYNITFPQFHLKFFPFVLYIIGLSNPPGHLPNLPVPDRHSPDPIAPAVGRKSWAPKPDAG